MSRHLVLCLALAAAALPARAEQPHPWSFGERQSDVLVGWLGGLRPEGSNPAPKGDGIALGIGWERHLSSGLRFGFEFSFYGADYRTPASLSCGAFCVVSSTMSLNVMGFGPTAGYAAKLGPVELHAGAGFGLYFSTLTATASTFGFPGEHEERDSDLAMDVRAGVGIDVGTSTRLGVELRRLSLEGSFGPLTGGRSIPIGGDFVLFSYGRRF